MPNDRPKVGEADPETRRKKLREALDAEAEDAWMRAIQVQAF